MPIRWRAAILLPFAIALSLGWLRHSKAADYMSEAPPRRLALVVGNSDYVNAPKLPGSALDADKMKDLLTGLGFDVTPAKDVTSRGDFVFNYLKPFLAKVQEGDVVVFYFSGHGFSYGGENYITPLDFPIAVPSDDILSTFISTTGIEIQLTERRPALVFMMLDACRSIPNFVVKTNGKDDGQVSKGLAEPRKASSSTIYWFSSAIGAISIGSVEKKVSVYTQALSENIAVDARELDDVRREVRFLVKFRTREKQVPWSTESSSAQVYLKPSPEILAKQKDMWKVAFDDGTQLSVQRFAEIYGTGPYGAGARRWLKDNPNAPEVSASRVSPAAVEAAWSVSDRSSNVLLPQVNGALAPPATAVVASIEPEAVTQPTSDESFEPSMYRLPGVASAVNATKNWMAEKQAVANAFETSAGGAAGSARSLERLGGALVVQSMQARSRPTVTASVSEVLKPGQSLSIEGVSTDRQNHQWIWARAAPDGPLVYIEQKTSAAQPIDVGQALVEVALNAPAVGLRTAVDEAPLLDALKTLKADHKALTWVSIATPKPQKPGQDAVYGLQALYVRSVLAKNGVPHDRVTTSEGASSNASVRVRIFGKDN